MSASGLNVVKELPQPGIIELDAFAALQGVESRLDVGMQNLDLAIMVSEQSESFPEDLFAGLVASYPNRFVHVLFDVWGDCGCHVVSRFGLASS
jgi:hypothetical protein